MVYHGIKKRFYYKEEECVNNTVIKRKYII